MDLKLTVAEASVGVLRANRNLETARSNVEQLASFARDVKNRLDQGLAIQSDNLAAQVSLANAQLSEIQARTSLESAMGDLQPLPSAGPSTSPSTSKKSRCCPPTTISGRRWPRRVVATRGEFAGKNDRRGPRPDGPRDSAQARVEEPGRASPLAERPGRRDSGQPPAASLGQRRVYLCRCRQLHPPGERRGQLHRRLDLDRLRQEPGRQAAALNAQERATAKSRADLAADIALQIRTRWLDLQQAKQKVPIARFAVIQAEENV